MDLLCSHGRTIYSCSAGFSNIALENKSRKISRVLHSLADEI